LYEKLKLVLTDDSLANTLIENGLATTKYFGWSRTMDSFIAYQTAGGNHLQNRNFTLSDMTLLLSRLHDDGLYTPEPVFCAMRGLYEHLENACKRFLHHELSKDMFVVELKDLEKDIDPYLKNSRAEYYESFKARRDAIRLMICLSDSADLEKYVRVLCEKTDAVKTAVSGQDTKLSSGRLL
jgi:hypothetical protein